MKKVFNLKKGNMKYATYLVCEDNEDIFLCVGGVAEYFDIKEEDVEDEVRLTISRKPFKGSTRVDMVDQEVDGIYISDTMRHALSEIFDTDSHDATYYVLWEVE